MEKVAIVVLLVATVLESVSAACTRLNFKRTLVHMCLRPEFIRDQPVPQGDELQCALACNRRGTRCQGFQLTGENNARCQTLEFDRCSHMVNAANCSQFAWTYVRQQQNLPSGQLCSDGFGSGYHGSTYKIVAAANWTDGLAKCSSLPGLTKFADGIDTAEVAYMHWIKNNVNSGASYFVGGFRIGTAASGTWLWQACNATVLPQLWSTGQPNEGDAANILDIWTTHTFGLDDSTNVYPGISMALCECVNPFA